MEEELSIDLARARIHEDQAKIERNIKLPRPSSKEALHKFQRECKADEVDTLYIQHSKS